MPPHLLSILACCLLPHAAAAAARWLVADAGARALRNQGNEEQATRPNGSDPSSALSRLVRAHSGLMHEVWLCVEAHTPGAELIGEPGPGQERRGSMWREV